MYWKLKRILAIGPYAGDMHDVRQLPAVVRLQVHVIPCPQNRINAGV